jgi:hypothetical protein
VDLEVLGSSPRGGTIDNILRGGVRAEGHDGPSPFSLVACDRSAPCEPASSRPPLGRCRGRCLGAAIAWRLATGDWRLATGAAVRDGSEHLRPPVRGQILRSRGRPKSGPVVRGDDACIAPGAAGAVVGATMEPADDRIVDPRVVKRLLDAGSALIPDLAAAPHTAAAAVRACTPDGLPARRLVQRSPGGGRRPGVKAGLWRR